MPLVDEARALLAERPRSFGHVIVDEAQDLTPMQLRMVARRAASGSITILGDIAQATGPVAYDGWASVLAHLPGEEAEVEELRHAYRVPAEIMELALPLLDRIAPDVSAPVAFRAGGEPPRIERVAEGALVTAALRAAGRLAREEGLLAVILPDALVPGLRGRLGATTTASPCSPRDARRGSSSTTSSWWSPRSSRRARPASASSTSPSRARPARWSSCTPARCPRSSTRDAHDFRSGGAPGRAAPCETGRT